MSTLALFDFDGTITTHDSLIKFIRFAVGDAAFAKGMLQLSPMLAAYKFKLIPNDKAKALMLSHFFKGMPEEKFRDIASTYALTHIDTILRPKAMERIVWHQEEGHEVVIVSASMECWLKPWCEKHNIALLGTQLEMQNGMVSGKFLTKNCYGAEKANRVRQVYDLERYELIYAYGDSRGDRELLSLAHTGEYKPFRRSRKRSIV